MGYVASNIRTSSNFEKCQTANLDHDWNIEVGSLKFPNVPCAHTENEDGTGSLSSSSSACYRHHPRWWFVADIPWARFVAETTTTEHSVWRLIVSLMSWDTTNKKGRCSTKSGNVRDVTDVMWRCSGGRRSKTSKLESFRSRINRHETMKFCTKNQRLWVPSKFETLKKKKAV